MKLWKKIQALEIWFWVGQCQLGRTSLAGEHKKAPVQNNYKSLIYETSIVRGQLNQEVLAKTATDVSVEVPLCSA